MLREKDGVLLCRSKAVPLKSMKHQLKRMETSLAGLRALVDWPLLIESHERDVEELQRRIAELEAKQA